MSESQVWIHSGEACDGVPILYHLTRAARDEGCPDCKAGVCVQRVERCDVWETRLVVHGQQREAN